MRQYHCIRNLIKWNMLGIFLILLVSSVTAQTICTAVNRPKLVMDDVLILNEDEIFVYDINVTPYLENVVISWVPINISLKLNLHESGFFNITPASKDVGQHSVFILATTPAGCFDMKKLILRVYDKPTFTGYYPDLSIVMNETQFMRFTANVTTKLQNQFLFYEWYVNDKKVKTYSTFYYFFTNYSDAGEYVVKLVASDSRGLNNSLEWNVRVKNKNRGPYLKFPFPDIAIRYDTQGELFNLYNYIVDPDQDKLNFSIFFVDPLRPDILFNSSRIFDLIATQLGGLNVFPKAEIYIKQGVRIKATDPEGLSLLSDTFTLRIATSEDATEYFTKRISAEKCQIDLVCSEWSECLPTNIMIRDCYDANNCNLENQTLTESKECEYNATCFDNIKNQGEEDVDCGGPCEPCPTCSDGIKNQGEEDVDCGGPCPPCPNCYDGKLNQDETDIDCGGICDGCPPGSTCEIHTDCQSLMCINNVCNAPTCHDGRKNQGEENVDCGGPCEPCPTCTDGIINQNEEDVDCGGPCKACITCHDGIRNQGELFVDCGGPCKPCNFVTFVVNYRQYLFVLIPVVSGLLVIIIVRKMYVKNPVGFKSDLANIFGFLPKKLPDNARDIIIGTVNKMNSVKQLLFTTDDKSKITENYNSAINDFFRQMLEFDGTLTKGVVKSALKTKVFNPFLNSLFMQIFISTEVLNPNAPLFKIETNQTIEETINLLNTIRELV